MPPAASLCICMCYIHCATPNKLQLQLATTIITRARASSQHCTICHHPELTKRNSLTEDTPRGAVTNALRLHLHNFAYKTFKINHLLPFFIAHCYTLPCTMTIDPAGHGHSGPLLGGTLGHWATYTHLAPVVLHCSLATWRMLGQPAA
jgi:hypothetical protein